MLGTIPVRAADLTNGKMSIVPVKGGQAPAIDGDLKDWDLSASEPVWMAPETASAFNARYAMMYDDDAMYIGARISLPSRKLSNTNNPLDAFWKGDVLQWRVITDPALPYPANQNGENFLASNRVQHISMWKNTATGQNNIHIAAGVKFDKGAKINPAGAVINITEHEGYFILEAKLPWSVLNVPDGKNPFKPGQSMTSTIEMVWGSQAYRVLAIYNRNPGAFSFNSPQTWGRLEFSPTGNLTPRPTLEEAIAALAPKPVGVPIEIEMPREAKLSVNIVSPAGEVIRELAGGELHAQGKTTVYWDGRDQWGTPVAVGDYKWAAYISNGLKAQYVGTAGTSGNPPHATADGTGEWGADHGNPEDVAADATGWYFLWHGAEAGRAIVKVDGKGKTLWRKTPFVGGGFGPHYVIAANGKYAFVTFGKTDTNLVRLDAATGQMLPFGRDAMVPIADPSGADRKGMKNSEENLEHFGDSDLAETSGLAASAREVFAPLLFQESDSRSRPGKRRENARIRLPQSAGCGARWQRRFVCRFGSGGSAGPHFAFRGRQRRGASRRDAKSRSALRCRGR